MTELTTFEKAVMEKLLFGDLPLLRRLHRQLSFCRVKEREQTGVGFFTTFSHEDYIEKIPGKTFKFGDVEADIDGLEHGAGFLLYIEDGVLDMLEGYTYDEPWPTFFRGFKLTYTSTSREERDWAVLEEKLQQA